MLVFNEQEINKVYASNKRLAEEELTFEGDFPPDEDEVHRLATEWTVDEVCGMLHRHLDRRWATRQDSVNKNFFG